MTKDEALKLALEALVVAEAGLADIGDADRDPTDDLAWCEKRAAQALAIPRQAITALREAVAQPEERNFCPRCGKRTADPTTIHTCTPPQGNT